nr:MAG TPA: GRIP-related Arf-binding domain [Crassvirales sp.]
MTARQSSLISLGLTRQKYLVTNFLMHFLLCT